MDGELDNLTPGKVTGWLRFFRTGRDPLRITLDLAGDFHDDIRGTLIRLKNPNPSDRNAELGRDGSYADGIARVQRGTVGDITAGLPLGPWTESLAAKLMAQHELMWDEIGLADRAREARRQEYSDRYHQHIDAGDLYYPYVAYPYIEWYAENGRVVLELDPPQVEIVVRNPTKAKTPAELFDDERKRTEAFGTFMTGLLEDISGGQNLREAERRNANSDGDKMAEGRERRRDRGAASHATLVSAIDSAARGDNVCRRRFQRGSVFKNRAGTVWLGMFTEYVLDASGVERRKRRQIVLGPVRRPDGAEVRKREAQRLLQPYVDRANASFAEPARQYRTIAFDAFAEIWKRDYLTLSKPSTQATMRSQTKRLVAAFEKIEMRSIGAADLQRIIADMEADDLASKTIRNLWATVRLLWDAALAQGYVDRLLPKPKLPRASRKTPRYFRLEEVAKIIAHASGERRALYWLAAETGLRAGELAGLRLEDVEVDRIRVSRSVWHGRVQTPKTSNALRLVAVSAQLGALLSEQAERQRAKGHLFLFTASSGSPLDASLFRQRKLRPMLRKLKISEAGFHAFRHFNASLLSLLRVPLKVIQERLGHASGGSLTLDIYTHTEWKENIEAAKLAGEQIEKAVDSVSLTAIQEEGLAYANQQAPASV